ncbi:tRNA adenosine(34) deaminase TadA [Candidatus Pantoea carbekii]|uniref:tRNA-specific adenosine deaminase n=1 Tax=Candidatus Pantoea carbekii TaxID=1235990 RepID=U3U9C1_9GAMM|nr:tRNA adenosine(34) deaminase TadA [Candidatus Pantoea carbekii]AKC31869.1 cytosine_adenosine deaminase [Candidatus Pantoea carbekii]BAO00383.1 hypothetical protein HHS_04130 [Candidatus Pantoea carbekii]
MTVCTDQYWMHYALELAHYACKQGEVPVGAVLIQKNKIIAEGWNQPISQNDPTAHAEIMALRKGGKVLKNYRLLNTILYVTLEPCLMCVGAMMHSRITRLVYGAKDRKTAVVSTFFKKIDYLQMNHNIKIDSGILADECREILNKFFLTCRNKKFII